MFRPDPGGVIGPQEALHVHTGWHTQNNLSKTSFFLSKRYKSVAMRNIQRPDREHAAQKTSKNHSLDPSMPYHTMDPSVP